MCSIAAVHDFELFLRDVKTVFLYGDLDQELYVKQPEGFVEPSNQHLVCCLPKLLNGFVQSAKKRNEKVDSFITRFSMKRSISNPCVYFHQGEGTDDLTLFGIWVDDGILATDEGKSKSYRND